MALVPLQLQWKGTQEVTRFYALAHDAVEVVVCEAIYKENVGQIEHRVARPLLWRNGSEFGNEVHTPPDICERDNAAHPSAVSTLHG